MKTEFLSNEAKIKIAELQSEITAAKEKIKMAMSNDIGVNYIINTDKKAVNVLNFSKSLDVIPVYLEIIKNCYACMDEIVKKSIETERHNEEKREYTEVNWAKALSDAVKCMNSYNNQSEIPQGEYKFCMNIDWGNRRENQIKIGDRVKLKGDSNSPEMTVTRDCAAEAQVQRGTIGKGVQEETKYSGTDNNDPYAIFECSYFINKDEDVDFINRNCRQFQFHKDALEKLIPVQPTCKKEPSIEVDVKEGDFIQFENGVPQQIFKIVKCDKHRVTLQFEYIAANQEVFESLMNQIPFKKVN